MHTLLIHTITEPNDQTICPVGDGWPLLKISFQGHTLQGKGHIGSKKTVEEVHAFDVAFLAILLFILPFAFAGI